MAVLGSLDVNPREKDKIEIEISTDESVGGMLIDLSGFANPFEGYPQLYSNFGQGKTVCIYNMDEAEKLGIRDNGFLNGLLYYHVSQFYRFIDRSQELYLCLRDCSEGWDAIPQMQTESGGRLFQIGVWTSQHIWERDSDDKLRFTSLIQDLQLQADEVCGRTGESGNYYTPLSIILTANASVAASYRELPDARELKCPKVSLVIGQSGTDKVRQMQTANSGAQVGALGLVMACLSICGAEASIASVLDCNLNEKDQFTYPELGFGRNSTPIDDINTLWRNILSDYGYIFPVDYDGLEAGYYLNCDNTLTEGDYSTISNNRVMHKCRRTVNMVLLPYVNSNHVFDFQTKNIDVVTIAMISDSISTALDTSMRNSKGFQQIAGKSLSFVGNENMLEDDKLSIRLSVLPLNYNRTITEEVGHEDF